MAHVRTQIRDALQQILQDNVTTVIGANIDKGRTRPFTAKDLHSDDEDELPAINIVTDDQNTDSQFIQGDCSKYKNSQTVYVEVYVSNGDDYEASLDEICVEVEKAIADNPKLGLPIKQMRYESSKISRDAKEFIFVGRVLEYSAIYKASHQDPETFIN